MEERVVNAPKYWGIPLKGNLLVRSARVSYNRIKLLVAQEIRPKMYTEWSYRTLHSNEMMGFRKEEVHITDMPKETQDWIASLIALQQTLPDPTPPKPPAQLKPKKEPKKGQVDTPDSEDIRLTGGLYARRALVTDTSIKLLIVTGSQSTYRLIRSDKEGDYVELYGTRYYMSECPPTTKAWLDTLKQMQFDMTPPKLKNILRTRRFK